MQSAKVTGSKIIDERQSVGIWLENNNAFFNQKIQQAMNKNYTDVKELGVFELRQDPTPNMFYFHANKYNSDQHEAIQQYILSEIQHFYNNNDTSYAIAYIHSSFVDFLGFRKFLQKWPRHFIERLRKVYIVQASFMVKVIEVFSFGTFGRLCDDLFLNLGGEAQLQMSDQAVMREIGQDPSAIKNKKVYKDSIKIIENELYGKTIDQYELYTGKYPVILLQLLRRILQNEEQLRTEGIFRKNCDVEELERLEQDIIQKKPGTIDNQKDIFVVCGCMKKILNNLRLPLFNYDIYNRVIAFSGGDEIEFVRKILQDMDYINHKVFILLMMFMIEFVISQQQYNKMTAYNMSVVFGPCFFRPKEYDLKDLIYSGKFAKVLVTCFEHSKELLDPAEQALTLGILRQLRAGSLIP